MSNPAQGKHGDPTGAHRDHEIVWCPAVHVEQLRIFSGPMCFLGASFFLIARLDQFVHRPIGSDAKSWYPVDHGSPHNPQQHMCFQFLSRSTGCSLLCFCFPFCEALPSLQWWRRSERESGLVSPCFGSHHSHQRHFAGRSWIPHCKTSVRVFHFKTDFSNKKRHPHNYSTDLLLRMAQGPSSTGTTFLSVETCIPESQLL